MSDSPQPYRVLARTYRPQTFAELIGQDAMVQTLGNAIKRGRLAHAFLMTGILGGFTTFSAFSMDTISLAQRGETALAAGYVVASVLFSLAAFVCAAAVTRSLI